MNYKLYPIKYEVYDPEVDALCAIIECHDEATSTVEVLDKIHTAESFEELSAKIIEALKLMHPKEDV